MYSKSTNRVAGEVNGLEENNSIDPVPPINPQVKVAGQKTIRRKFSAADKLKLIQSFDACADAAERGAFLRKNGLYYSGIMKWKRKFSGAAASQKNSKAYKSMLVNKQLEREVASLKKKLAQAEAIIDIQKKVSQLLSISALDHEKNEGSL